ncbi:class I SAM-dependent methyltransferase [Frankia sp. CNm7]|uniref:Class I SAM-dependent methyltransferase n=1 Tax=Frankia nepalensis TaxID=1836974 RepID=A0A937RFT6_9ACTN|nr:class I SAM-dependent methyltransferase [Frankia nepalensis]MBL7500805.1 class I SAM-dependent methyltransferase [Frankia nepalensis]MBL7512612.1 class I SAM-dependent methyltransferase [Frankia nepalensis]MBL7523052.1 class I SAM-dependent methyltransferase [Frankia nepalensis]MBL7628195.1 class I SAM-dependent methyltransferase [Frankia nepalensis]
MRRWFAITTCVLVTANGVRLRLRLRDLARAARSADPVAGTHAFLVADGVGLPDEARRAASAHALREGLEVLDLVPEDLSAERLLDLARLVDTSRYRGNRFAAGRGANQALLVDRRVLARAGIEEREDYSPLELAELTRRLKQYAPSTSDLVVVAGLTASRPGAAQRVRGQVAAYRHPFQGLAFLPAARAAAVAASCVASPGWGLAAAALSAAQPAAVAAGRVSPGARDTLAGPARRLVGWPGFAVDLARARRAGVGPDPEASPRRRRYQEEIAAGVEGLLETRRDTCPWCGSAALALRAESGDTTLRKPGLFRYEQCADCALIFQNPRLTPAGLDFYYRDFYDGLNAERAEGMFGASDLGYRARAALLPPEAKPANWLDVGAGHGHFCLVAAGMLPGVGFDAVDMGDGIDAAERRGWVRHAYRKMFPEIVDEIAGRYDVISMFHYLEHTPDPKLELDTAAAALPAGGHLIIEVPHGQGPSFKLFRGLWVGLCPPQHLHFIPPDELVKALADRGLTTVTTQFSQAHLFGDAVAVVYYLAQKLQPNPTLPWLPDEATPARWARRVAALAVTAPLYPVAFAVDALMLPYLLTGRRANIYRVVARKEPDSAPTAAGGASAATLAGR